MKRKPSKAPPRPSATGTYAYDAELGRIVKVSDSVPKVASKGAPTGRDFGSEAGPCGRSQCGGGSCAMGEE